MPLKLLGIVYDIIITSMETVGMVFVACGLGVFCSWVAGWAGFLVVTGLGLIAAALISGYQRAKANVSQSMQPPSTLPPNWPPTRNATNGTTSEPAAGKSRLQRFADWVYETK